MFTTDLCGICVDHVDRAGVDAGPVVFGNRPDRILRVCAAAEGTPI